MIRQSQYCVSVGRAVPQRHLLPDGVNLIKGREKDFETQTRKEGGRKLYKCYQSSHLFHDSIPAEASSLVPGLWSTLFLRIPRGERPGANPRKRFQALLICKKRSVLFPVLSICRVRDALYLILVRCLWLAAHALRYRTWWRTCCPEKERYVFH